MRISFIGMSGSGKSSWSRRFSEHGFTRFCCDEMIARKLARELRRTDGTLMALGTWMGWPDETGYSEREARYLHCEMEVLAEICDYLADPGNDGKQRIVVDTTGSVVYAGEDLLERLRRRTVVVHLSTPPEIREQMLSAYLRTMRPVLWRDHFTRHAHETREQALARGYPALLASREQLYGRAAHITIDHRTHAREGLPVTALLEEIRDRWKRIGRH